MNAAQLDANSHARFEAKISAALDRTLAETIQAEPSSGPLTIDASQGRFIIFSDLHKGARNRADDFLVAEQTYNAALGYYYRMGHTLVGLGDVEELWEERAQPVIASYEYTLRLEAKFHREGRYLRFWGNHDDDWSYPDLVHQYLEPIYGPLPVREAMRIRVMDGADELGTIFMAHGHQGTLDSDRFAFLSKPLVRYGWRPFQRLTGISLNTPARSWQLRDYHNRAMYQWASRQPRTILIVGHTHRPVFESRLHAAKIREEIAEIEIQIQAAPDNYALLEKVSLLAAELEWVLAQERQMPGAEGEEPVTSPCYFNTGCCCFYDGDITGIEIANGGISLVRWPNDRDSPAPRVLETASLKEVFARL